MLISEILSVKPDGTIYSIAPDRPLTEAVDRMVDHDVGSLLVVVQDQLVGIVTERDVLKAIHAHGCDFNKINVKDVMSLNPIFGSPNDTVDYVRGVMTENRISHLIVMENDKTLGVISFHDVAKACLSETKFENTLLKRYIKHWPE